MSALAAATRATLLFLGYKDDLIFEQFPVWLGARDVMRIDAAVFAASPADMTTAAITVSQLNGAGNIERDQLCRAALALATPIAVEADSSRIRIFSVDHQSGLNLIEDTAVDERDVIGRLRSELSPRSLLEAKLGSRQTALFPVDVRLLSSARTKAKNELTGRIDETLTAVAELLGETTAPGLADDETSDIVRERTLRSSRIVVGALTCAYIRDKNNLRGIPAQLLPVEAERRYPDYFDWLRDTPGEYELLLAAIDSISHGMSFRGMAPDIVTDPYESVIVSTSERKALGIHYTPPEIASRLLQALPMEELSPTRRSVLDPTCGSGTLLLAAYDRLRLLEPESYFETDSELEEQHQRLTGQLFGYDKDPFAVQITKLALLLHDQSDGNGWNVTVRDTLSGEDLKSNASVLVANPPWLFSSEDRIEHANRFVNRMLNSLGPNGLLGIILPSHWLTSEASRVTRRRLNNECDVFEVWRLPELVFPSSRAAPGVVCARKRNGIGGKWRVFRRVVASHDELDRFYRSGIATESSFTSSDDSMVTGPLSVALAGRADMQPLGDFVDVRVGSQPQKWLTRGLQRKEGTHLWLRNAGTLQMFGSPPEEALVPVIFPGDFHRNTPVEIAAGQKVLVSATRWADNPWRLKVGIDLKGVIVRNSLNIVLLKEEVTSTLLDKESMLYALMALLGSGLASLWIDEHATKRSPSENNFLSLPVPRDVRWRHLASLGRLLFEVHDDPVLLHEAVQRLEEFIWDAYDLPKQAVSTLIRRLSLKQPPERGTRYPLVSEPEPTSHLEIPTETRIGAVLSVEDDGIRLWINTVTPSSGMKVPLPERFPGCLMYEDATFETDATTVDAVVHARYWLQRETWRDDEQLDEYVNT